MRSHRDCGHSEDRAGVPLPHCPPCCRPGSPAGWRAGGGRPVRPVRGLLCTACLMLSVNPPETSLRFSLGANLPNGNDRTTLCTDVSLFLKAQFAFNECSTWHLVVARRGVPGPGDGAVQVGEPLTGTVLLFSFNQILRRKNRVKHLQEMFLSRKLLKLMPLSTRSALEKCFAHLRALYVRTRVVGAGVRRTSVEKELLVLGVYF